MQHLLCTLNSDQILQNTKCPIIERSYSRGCRSSWFVGRFFLQVYFWASIPGVKYVVDNRPSPVAIYITAGKKFYCVGDRIAIRCPQKRQEAALCNGPRPYTDGVISRINRCGDDNFFVVTLNDGREVTLSLKKIKKVTSCSECFRIRNQLYFKVSEWQVEVDNLKRQYDDIAKKKAWSTLFTIDQIVGLYYKILKLKCVDYGQWDIPECQNMYNGAYNALSWAYHNMTHGI